MAGRFRKADILSTRQVGQRIRRGTLPSRADGVWRCPRHPKARLGVSGMLQWPKGSRAHGTGCPPSQLHIRALGIIIDFGR